jgi:hypothetical protein
MITWLTRDIASKWLRVIISGVIFAWLIWIAFWENRHYRNMTVMFTQQFETLHNDHARAEAAMKLLAEQVFKSTQAVKKSTQVIEELPDAVKEHR